MPRGATAGEAAEGAPRAAELLKAAKELDGRCRRSPRDKAVRGAAEELFAAARAEGVRLPPPPWLLPEGLRAEYLHAPGQSCGPGEERNLLVLLHGFGGRKDAFLDFAKRLQLPKTAVLALDGPLELPAELVDDPPAFGWFAMLDEESDLI